MFLVDFSHYKSGFFAHFYLQNDVFGYKCDKVCNCLANYICLGKQSLFSTWANMRFCGVNSLLVWCVGKRPLLGQVSFGVLWALGGGMQKQFTYFAICCIMTSNLIVLQRFFATMSKILLNFLLWLQKHSTGHYGNKTHLTTK